MNETSVVTELHDLECWERLRSETFGRLAFHLLNEVHIVPINYEVRGQELFFRTAEGDKLLGVLLNGDVALEIDQVGRDTGWSVVARGRARKLAEDEADALDSVLVQSWIDTPKYDVVAIHVQSVTGRGFTLNRPEPTTADAARSGVVI